MIRRLSEIDGTFAPPKPLANSNLNALPSEILSSGEGSWLADPHSDKVTASIVSTLNAQYVTPNPMPNSRELKTPQRPRPNAQHAILSTQHSMQQ